MTETEEKPKTYFEQELEKTSLREPPFNPKITWMKSLSVFTTLEFKGKI